MNKVSVLVDGFNLYHSIKDIQRDHDRNLRWLDIRSLCSSYLHLISKDATIENIYYFTAFAIHLNDSSVISRHRNYIECLQDTGIIVEYGRFKPKSITCSNCHSTFIKHEEKETDVRIATKVCHLLAKDECDTILLVSGDTDLSPSIEHAKL